MEFSNSQRMDRFVASSLVILTLALLPGNNADAYGSLRCKGKMIDVGMHIEKVLALCGEPETKHIEQVPVRSRTFTGFSRFSGVSYTELWEYDRGWGKFAVVLIFRDETLKRVEHARQRSGAR